MLQFENQYYHISINLKTGLIVKNLQINKILEEQINWIKYMPNCYIVVSNGSIDSMYYKIKSLLGEGEHVFICELKLENRQGWLPKSVWKWIRENYS